VDKIKILKVNKKLTYCMLIITIAGVISGSLFLALLKDVDRNIAYLSLENFINNLDNLSYVMSLKSSLITNILYVIIIWSLGISIIGIPLTLFLYFIRTFSVGFTISLILSKYSIKGLIYGFIYLFPHTILNIFIFSILSIYSIIYSFKTSSSFFKKEVIDFKPVINKYKYILVLSILIVILTSLYGTYIMPLLFKLVLKLGK